MSVNIAERFFKSEVKGQGYF